MKKVDKLINHWTKIAVDFHPLNPDWQYERIIRLAVEAAIKLDRAERKKRNRKKK